MNTKKIKFLAMMVVTIFGSLTNITLKTDTLSDVRRFIIGASPQEAYDEIIGNMRRASDRTFEVLKSPYHYSNYASFFEDLKKVVEDSWLYILGDRRDDTLTWYTDKYADKETQTKASAAIKIRKRLFEELKKLLDTYKVKNEISSAAIIKFLAKLRSGQTDLHVIDELMIAKSQKIEKASYLPKSQRFAADLVQYYVKSLEDAVEKIINILDYIKTR
jgi:hypothetical protein